jgi:hypothetical protein
VAAVALLLSLALACAEPQPGSPVPGPEPDSASTTVASETVAPVTTLPPEPMEWPDPLPGCGEDVPTLSKGLVVGTWVPEGPLGFHEAWLDETGLTEVRVRDKVGRRTWRAFTSGGATVNLDPLLSDRTGPALGYLFSVSGRGLAEPAVADMPAVLHVRHAGRLQLWFESRPVLDAPAPAPGEWGEARLPVELRGRHSILLAKCGRGSAELGRSMELEVRLSRPDGTPIEGQSWSSMRLPGLYSDP